jgi:hypothetical protein
MSSFSSFPAASLIALETASAVALLVRIVVDLKSRSSAIRAMSFASASHAFSFPDHPL